MSAPQDITPHQEALLRYLEAPFDWPTVMEWIRAASSRDTVELVRLVGEQVLRHGYREHGRELLDVARSLQDLERTFQR